MRHTPSERVRAWLLRLVAVVLVLLALAFTGLRVLVAIAPDFRDQTEARLSAALGQPLQLGGLRAAWHGLNPAVVLEDVELQDAAGEPPLKLAELELTIGLWDSLTSWQLRPAEVAVEGVALELTRRADGTLEAAALGRRLVLGAAGEQAPPRRLPAAIRLRRGELTLVDEVTGQRHRIPRLDLRLKQLGERNELSVSAQLPEALGEDLQLYAHWSGRGTQLNAAAYLHGTRLDLAALSRYAPADWPRLGGRADAALWAELVDGRPSSLAAEFEARELVEANSKAALGALGGRLRWRATESGWVLEGDGLGPLAQDSTRTALRAEYQASGPDQGRLLAAVDRVVLDDWAPLAALLPEGRPAQLLSAARPRGTLAALGLRLQHDGRSIADLQFEAGFAGVALAPVERLPGLSGLNGRLQVDEHGGYAELEGYRGALELPRLFRDPLPFERVRAEGHWRFDAQGWEVAVPKLSLDSLDGKAQAELRLQGRRGERPFVQLRAHLEDGDVAQASRYLPAGIMHERLVGWLDGAIRGGRVEEAEVLYFGPGHGFPYEQGQGVFEVRAEVRDGVLAYREGWPSIQGLAASLRFAGAGMEIRAHRGQISGAALAPSVARIDNLRRGPLLVRGGAQASGAQLLRFLRETPLANGLDRTLQELKLEGTHPVSLDLTIPLRKGGGELALNGRLKLQHGRLSWPQRDFVLDDLAGELRFDRDGLSSDGVRARFRKQPLVLTAGTSGQGEQAQILLATALELEPAALLDQPPAWLSGRSRWDLSARLPGFRSGRTAGANVTAESDLQGLSLALPAPVGKSAGASVPFRLQTRIDGEGLRPVYFRYHDRLRGVLQWQQGRLERGTVRLGQGVPKLPPGPGFALTGEVRDLSLDQWRALAGEGGAGGGGALRWLDLEVGQLQAFGRAFRQVRAEGERGEAGWHLNLRGPDLAGEIELPARPDYGPVRLDLERLNLAPGAEPAAAQAGSAGEVPALDVAIDALALEGRELGSLFFVARPLEDGLAVDGLRLHAPWMTASGSLRWLERGDGARTEANLTLQAEDTGEALSRFGFAQTIEGGATEAEAALRWPGSPADFDPAKLSGQLALTTTKGRIPSVEPGPGRIFGVLSSLDFSDLFQQGFAFDRIKLRLKLAAGDAYPQVFFIEGPAARIAFAGRIGLKDRDYDQLVTVTPQVSSTLPVIGGLAGGPLGAAAAYVAQRLLKDKINKLTEYQYKVTGPWAKPQVQRIARREAGAAAQGDGS